MGAIGDTSNGARVAGNGGAAKGGGGRLRGEPEGGALDKPGIMARGFAEQAKTDGVGAGLTNWTIAVPCLAQMCTSSVVAAAKATTRRRSAQGGKVPQLKTVVADFGRGVFGPQTNNPVATAKAQAGGTESGIGSIRLLNRKLDRARSVPGVLHRMDGTENVRPANSNKAGIGVLQIHPKTVVDLIVGPVLDLPKRAPSSVSQRDSSNQNLHPNSVTGERKIRKGEVSHQHSVCLLQQTSDLLSRVLSKGHKNAPDVGAETSLFQVGVGSPDLSRIRENGVKSSADGFRGAPYREGNRTPSGEPEGEVPFTGSDRRGGNRGRGAASRLLGSPGSGSRSSRSLPPHYIDPGAGDTSGGT